MARKRYNRNNSTANGFLTLIFNIVKELPWWLNFVLGGVLYFLLHYLAIKFPIATGIGGNNIGIAIVASFGQYALPAILFVSGVVSLINQSRGEELLRNTHSSKTTEVVAKMSWQDFEFLMGQWFKKQGYDVKQAGGAQPDGGVDLELKKNGELYLVQCKHYRAWKVPVETVRDLYGVMTSRGASGGFVVTSGRFTNPAREFASGRTINLIDGEKLADILQQTNVNESETTQAVKNHDPKCPKCTGKMEHRTARHGKHAGNLFWGCSRYPVCKGTMPIS